MFSRTIERIKGSIKHIFCQLRKAANGEFPQIKLLLEYKHFPVRTAISVLQNKEPLLFEVPKPKFERPKLLHNVNRIKHFLPKGSTINRYKQSYEDVIAWKEPGRTVKYFVFYMFFVYYFNICWLPIFLIYILFINWRHKNNSDLPLGKVKRFSDHCSGKN